VSEWVPPHGFRNLLRKLFDFPQFTRYQTLCTRLPEREFPSLLEPQTSMIIARKISRDFIPGGWNSFSSRGGHRVSTARQRQSFFLHLPNVEGKSFDRPRWESFAGFSALPVQLLWISRSFTFREGAVQDVGRLRVRSPVRAAANTRSPRSKGERWNVDPFTDCPKRSVRHVPERRELYKRVALVMEVAVRHFQISKLHDLVEKHEPFSPVE
jgi:hypothetical protein